VSERKQTREVVIIIRRPKVGQVKPSVTEIDRCILPSLLGAKALRLAEKNLEGQQPAS
jgi:hypothetical protein